jgi:tripartite-type tricarboxylate transporter receptor subunit TctC
MKKIVAAIVALTMSLSVMASPTSTLKVPNELQGKTIKLVLPFNPGGGTDAHLRLVAEQVTTLTGVNITIVNRAGASGAVGAKVVSDAAPDGLTILGGENSTFVTNPAVEFPGAPDPKTLTPITVFAVSPYFMFVKDDGPIKTIDDIVKYAKSKGKVTVGMVTNNHSLAATEFFNYFNIDTHLVSFKTPVDMAIATHQGSIDLYFTDAPSGKPFVDAKKVRAVGIAWDKSAEVFSDAKPLTVLNPNFKKSAFFMVSAPAGTPAHILEFYNRAFRQAAMTKVSQERLQQMNSLTLDLTINQTKEFLDKEYKVAKRVHDIINKKPKQ